MLRVVLFVVLAFMTSAALANGYGAQNSQIPQGYGKQILQIPQGRLAGMMETSVKERPFWAFRSIPFAKPPVGPRRFKDPEPADGWRGVRDASSYPSRCLQQPFFELFANLRIAEGEEDCLYLNVYTPKINASLPVMVWIHGGGFFGGESVSYPPHAMLEHDIVFVVIQYRLGAFGFMSTEDSVIPGNFGLKDQTLALHWVQNNIGYFGGNRNEVTIFGESAGGASVHFQMLTPYAKGLFHRAILQSGNGINDWALNFNHKQSAQEIGESVGCFYARESRAFLECMQKVPGKKISLTTSHMFEILAAPLSMVPRIDGDYLPASPESLMACGKYNQVPMISGIVRDEGGIFTQQVFTNRELKEKLLSNFSYVPVSMLMNGSPSRMSDDQVRLALNYYVGNTNLDDKDIIQITKFYGDFGFNVGHDWTALLSSRFQPTYAYELKHRGNQSIFDGINTDHLDPTLRNRLRSLVSHADDIFYLFNSGLVPPLTDPVDLGLRDIIVALWVRFACTGNPTPDYSMGFQWKQISEASFQHLALKPMPSMEDDSRTKDRDFWLSLPAFHELRETLRNPPC